MIAPWLYLEDDGHVVEDHGGADDVEKHMSPGGSRFIFAQLGVPLRINILGKAIVVDLTSAFPRQSNPHMTVLWRKCGFSNDELHRVRSWFDDAAGEVPIQFCVKERDCAKQKLFAIEGRLGDL